MAESLARGWQTSGVLQASNMVATDVNASRLDVFKTLGVAAAKDAQEVRGGRRVDVCQVAPCHDFALMLMSSGAGSSQQ